MPAENLTSQQARTIVANMQVAPAPPGMGEECVLPVAPSRKNPTADINNNGTTTTVSLARVNYAIAHGEAPLIPEQFYMNSCKNSWCLNPKHAAIHGQNLRSAYRVQRSMLTHKVPREARTAAWRKAARNATWDGDCLISNYKNGIISVRYAETSRVMPARQAAWEYYANHLMPEGVAINTSCGNKACVNPRHFVAIIYNSRMSGKNDPFVILPPLAKRVYNAKPAVPKPQEDVSAVPEQKAEKPAKTPKVEKPRHYSPLSVLRDNDAPMTLREIQKALPDVPAYKVTSNVSELCASGVVTKNAANKYTITQTTPESKKGKLPVKYVKTSRTQVLACEPAKTVPDVSSGYRTVINAALMLHDQIAGYTPGVGKGLHECFSSYVQLSGHSRADGDAEVTLGELREFVARVAVDTTTNTEVEATYNYLRYELSWGWQPTNRVAK